ncbi:MAG: ABC transporter ATP-binding protein [Chloroflexi bacterium]|nr:ABC transporter ATP-binding protein [Chloroflexota bacterium]
MHNLAVSMTDICKSYGKFKANDHVSLHVRPGTIHCLVGENGAGKTTLMNILYGLIQKDYGEIKIFGQPANVKNPIDANGYGISMVHQHFKLVPSFTVLENVILGTSKTRGPLLDKQTLEPEILQLCNQFGLEIDLQKVTEDIPVGSQQRVEILKALYRGTEILILDEPTAVLTPQESEQLFITLEALAQSGTAIIFITHKLREVFRISSEITVMRGGRTVGTVFTKDVTDNHIVRMMIGKSISLSFDKKGFTERKVVLSLQKINLASSRSKPILENVSFEIAEGEILGIAGIEGNGQSELVEVISGAQKATSGKTILDGDDVSHFNVRERRNIGVVHIPEDRNKTGVNISASLLENMIANNYFMPDISSYGFISESKASSYTVQICNTYNVKSASVLAPISSLSGGNIQKAIVGRELSMPRRLLLASQPTRGVDIGSIEYIYSKLIEYRNNGLATLLVSSDLAEILTMSDRIAVIYEGKIVSILNAHETNEIELGFLMTGSKEN